MLVTELIFENVFTDLDASEVVALLSCFVFQEKSENEPVLTANLENGKKRIVEITKKLAKLQRNFGVDLSEEDYLGTLKFGLVEVVYEWARGMVNFIKIFFSKNQNKKTYSFSFFFHKSHLNKLRT